MAPGSRIWATRRERQIPGPARRLRHDPDENTSTVSHVDLLLTHMIEQCNLIVDI